ncbi:RagB/SusD family nutrient uptake outer membrane protein [Arachidicoccus terrestris]|uniref:RagB/SusD family nutrient uptake outer membrane protein n=1 Tax=Arachidicoccus terrestris TaxID=2875539 RepID=UPI001CC3B9F1|nr:RagB/SusD family nutrient uptake outer membrane protein [Arachidicoccus terrestris]UAY55368.1 RagB/SusD family nutrient uptake outer membrane protein [Arachidicoccus terrestris]
MKNKLLVIVLGICAVLTACQKNFLDRAPLSEISDADYWKSANDLRLYVNNFYNGLPSYIQSYFNFGIYSEDDAQGSDNMVNYQYDQDLNGARTLPSSGGGWSYGNWSSIRNVNYFLDNYHKVEGDPTEIKKYVGEALFFKAWYYFDKLKSFGDLPWLTHVLLPNDSSQLHNPRLSRDIVVDSMMRILDTAIAYLPSKGGGGYEEFRVYKELAELFQSRIALYEGTWEKYHAGTDYGVAGADGRKFLTKAYQAAEAVMNAGMFGLDNVGEPFGYWKLFNQVDYSGSKEVMFWRKYNADDGNYTFWARYMSLGGGRGITKSLVDAYLCSDGKPIAASSLYQGDTTLISVSTNRDPRLIQTIQVNDGKHYLNDTALFTHPSWGAAAEDNNYTGYQLYKGLNLDLIQHQVGKGTQGLIYFRYAEALLNYAEAKAELGTLTQSDVDKSINLLRDRVNMVHLEVSNITTDPNWKFRTLSPIINEIRRERRVEFACEGYRHDDIWRWNAAGILIKGWKPKGAKRQQFLNIASPSDISVLMAQFPVDGDDYIFPYKNNVIGANGFNFRTDRDYLLPLPTNQLMLNPKLSQNPGWPRQ